MRHLADLPLQGAGRSLRTEMNRAMAFVLSQQGWKAGKYTLGFQACDDATPQTGAWDSAKCTANATAYASATSGLSPGIRRTASSPLA